MHHDRRRPLLHDVDRHVERFGESEDLGLAAPFASLPDEAGVFEELGGGHKAVGVGACAVFALDRGEKGKEVVGVGLDVGGSGVPSRLVMILS
jgi:hypothetical protein